MVRKLCYAPGCRRTLDLAEVTPVNEALASALLLDQYGIKGWKCKMTIDRKACKTYLCREKHFPSVLDKSMLGVNVARRRESRLETGTVETFESMYDSRGEALVEMFQRPESCWTWAVRWSDGSVEDMPHAGVAAAAHVAAEAEQTAAADLQQLRAGIRKSDNAARQKQYRATKRLREESFACERERSCLVESWRSVRPRYGVAFLPSPLLE